MLAPELIEPTVTVAREFQPYPHEGTLALAPLALLLMAISLLYAIKRRRVRRRGAKAGVLASLALGVALGNALCELDTMLRADRPAVVVMEMELPQAVDPGDERDPEASQCLPRDAPPPLA